MKKKRKYDPAARRKYYLAHKADENERDRLWRLNHPGEQANLSKAWRKKNHKRERAAIKEWDNRNPKAGRASHVAARMEKRGEGPAIKACRHCGTTEDLQKHHPDYDYPKVWHYECRSCHKKSGIEISGGYYHKISRVIKRHPELVAA